MTIGVGIPAVVGATGGAAVGFFVGGPAGAAAGGQFGASLGLKIGACIWGASTVEGIAKQTVNKALSLTEMGARYLLAGGIMTFAYWGTSRNTQETCLANSQHQICRIFPYINFGLLIFSGTAIIATISKSIFNINPKHESNVLLRENHVSSLSTDRNPCKICSNIGPYKMELKS